MDYLYVFLLACAVTFSSIPGNHAQAEEMSEQGKKYIELAQKYKPDSNMEPIVRKYMKLPSGEKKAFLKIQTKKGVRMNWPWDYSAYAVCFYSEWTGGGDAVEAGDHCHDLYLD